MRVKVVASGAADSAGQSSICYVINEVVAIDAGSLGLLPLEEQRRVGHVFLSHAHLDHVATLPLFLENVYTGDGTCPPLHASPAVLEALQRDLFNDRLWPDFIGLSARLPPFVRTSPLYAGEPVEVAGLRLRPVEVSHTVPTLGLLVEDGDAAVLFPSDTGPTEEVWRLANRAPGLRSVFLEVSFPDELAGLAGESMHLTPALFAREARKLRGKPAFLAVHLKPRYRERIIAQLRAAGLPNVTVAEPGREYVC